MRDSRILKAQVVSRFALKWRIFYQSEDEFAEEKRGKVKVPTDRRLSITVIARTEQLAS